MNNFNNSFKNNNNYLYNQQGLYQFNQEQSPYFDNISYGYPNFIYQPLASYTQCQPVFSTNDRVQANSHNGLNNVENNFYNNYPINASNGIKFFSPPFDQDNQSYEYNKFYVNNNMNQPKIQAHINPSDSIPQNLSIIQKETQNNNFIPIKITSSSNVCQNNYKPVDNKVTHQLQTNMEQNYKNSNCSNNYLINTEESVLPRFPKKNGNVEKNKTKNDSIEMLKKTKINNDEKLRRDYFSKCFKMLESNLGLTSWKRNTKAFILKTTRERIEKLNKKCIAQNEENQIAYEKALNLIQEIRRIREVNNNNK